MSVDGWKSQLESIEAVRFEDILASVDPLNMTDGQLVKLLDIKHELYEREKQYGILYYVPQEYQKKFHKCKRRVRFIFGANQTGKTESTVAEGISYSLGIDPVTKKRDPDIPVPNKGRIVGTDLDKGIGEVIQPKYQKLLPMSEVEKITRYPGGQWKKITYKNGSTTEFLSYEQDTKLFEGWTGHWVQFDEPPPQDKYVACLRGLIRYQGIVFGAMTPLDQPWIYDEIFLKAGMQADQPAVFCFSIYDNKYLEREAIETFIKSIPREEVEARVYGRFKHLTGLVFKQFSPEHRCESFEIPKDWTTYCAMDYHQRVPCAIVWVAVDPKGMAYVYDELWVDGTTKNIAEQIMAKEKGTGLRPVARWIDTLSATPDRTTGRSPQRDLAREGQAANYPLNFRGAEKTWVNGKNAVASYLEMKDGVPGILFFEDKVPRTINSFMHYMWDSTTATGRERAAKGDVHFVDALRYVLVAYPRYVDKERTLESMVDKRYAYSPMSGYHYGG